MTKVFLKDWNVFYTTRDGKINLQFEKYFSSQKLKNINTKENLKFDLVSICVRPIDMYSAWEKYKSFSDKFLIEKPGAASLEEFNKILINAEYEKKLIFVNYEFNYCETTKMLKEKIINSFDEIKLIELIWEKPMLEGGGLEWRLLPHMLAELFFLNPINLVLNEFHKEDKKLTLVGVFGKVPFSIKINDSNFLNHVTSITYKNGSSLVKNREKLMDDDKYLVKNSVPTLEKIIDMFNYSDNNIFKENNLISCKVLKILDEIK